MGEWDAAAGGLGKDDMVKAEKMYRDISIAGGKAGVLAGIVGQPWPTKYTSSPEPEGYDYFHELLTCNELSRVGGGGVWAIMGGLGIGLPPILTFGSEELKARVAPGCLSGEKVICLCITEPTAGSDVANVQTKAVDKGDHYIVSGTKKWITNGIYADYFTVLCRTGGAGAGGQSMLLIEKTMPGVITTKMKCMGVWPSGTTMVEFEDVKVPKANIIGVAGLGFKQTMFNFNHERWLLCAQASRLMQTCVGESLSFARGRETFGKRLVDHQVIQHKIAEMVRASEASFAMLEQLTFLMGSMSKDEQNAKLGGHIALCKVQVTKNLEFCAREAVQVLGGTGYTRQSKGEKVERIYREVRAFAIPGGSEEIMLNLAVSQLGLVPPVKKPSGKAAVTAIEKQIAGLQKKLAAEKAKL